MKITALDTEQEKVLLDLVEKRIKGIPLAHLTGRQQFMGVELLAGTGAGNLAVALTVLHPDIRTFAADLSKEAVSLAEKNVQFYKLEGKIILKVGDFLNPFNTSNLHNKVDLLLCTPPHISSAKVENMEKISFNLE